MAILLKYLPENYGDRVDKYVETVFSGCKRMDCDKFMEVNKQIASDSFYLAISLLHSKLPCAL